MAFPLIRFNGNEYEAPFENERKGNTFLNVFRTKTDIEGRMSVEQYENALLSPFLPVQCPHFRKLNFFCSTLSLSNICS